MTTTFTAIPMKMTMSASLALLGSIRDFYSTACTPHIDPDQRQRIFFVDVVDV